MPYGQLPEIELPDGSKVSGVRVRVPSSGKTAVLRLPTSAEGLDRLQAELDQKPRKRFGPEPSLKLDADLFKALRLDQGDPFDEYESANIIGKLTSCEAVSLDHEGDRYRVTLKTPFGETVHSMRIPSAKEVAEYRRALYAPQRLNGKEEPRYHFDATLDLYAATVMEIEGYADNVKRADVPPHHQAIVIGEVVRAFESFDPLVIDDPNS